MNIHKTLKAPLCTGWQEQYVTLDIDGLPTGAPVDLLLDGAPADFQYIEATPRGSRIMLRLGLEKEQVRSLQFTSGQHCATDSKEVPVPFDSVVSIGMSGALLKLAPPGQIEGGISAPFLEFAGFPLSGVISCNNTLVNCSLTRTSDGPLFSDYKLKYQHAGNHYYALQLRCYRHQPLIEVTEDFQMGLDAMSILTWNPEHIFDSILSHPPYDFGGDSQPTTELLNIPRPRDLLCRLQMPPLGEYAIPNNRGWFAFFSNRNQTQGMIGIMGLYGDKWIHPVENMPRVFTKSGAAEWHASLGSGRRHWLLYAGPVEKEFTPSRRFIFYKLHAEFNGLRLDEHLDLDGCQIFDATCWNHPGFLGESYRERAADNAAVITALRCTVVDDSSRFLRALLAPDPEHFQQLLDGMTKRFEKWIRDFQGYRQGQGDYAKNVIGFSRALRELLFDYELLRKEGFLTPEQIGKLNAYFIFAARRMRDEGRWPHSRTWKHPDHPESVRDLHAYPGEHRADKLVWSNSLPNFQSDPMCALLHVSALFPDHPEAAHWQRFALEDIERNLDAYCGKSGAWEESINYALYTFTYFTATFQVVKNRLGINYFEDERMRRFAGWLVRFLGPYDKRFFSYTYPGVGNTRLPTMDGGVLLCYASQLQPGDGLREDLLAAYQKMEPDTPPAENLTAAMIAAMAKVPNRQYALRPLASEHMDDLGVAMRHQHPSPAESYLIQKIGFWKDHYENDESSINWYAKGTPLVMDYGTYTPDVMDARNHNLVEVPDMDSLRRGYLAAHFFTPLVDYTRCEIPVGLPLLHGRIRSFEEIDEPSQPPLFFYIGDENPVGPKVWKTRLLLFIKPDYIAIFDRVHGPVPHRYNLHVTADEIRRDGRHIKARGRFDLDLHCLVQYPTEFNFEDGEVQPAPELFGVGETNGHRQKYFRLYNNTDGVYRTLLFAAEKGRQVSLEPANANGIKITTAQFTDFVFINDEEVDEEIDGGVCGPIRFSGRSGWIRRYASGTIAACMAHGNLIEAFGTRIEGRGPWHYNMAGDGALVTNGVPRRVNIIT